MKIHELDIQIRNHYLNFSMDPEFIVNAAGPHVQSAHPEELVETDEVVESPKKETKDPESYFNLFNFIL